MKGALLAALFAAASAQALALGPQALRGEAVYARCAACHSLETDRTGPRHCGLFGRRAGSVPGFPYSPAMAHAGFTWDAAMLDRFLQAPDKVVPGTSMTYAGVADAKERQDLVAFLREAGQGPACRK